MLLHPFSLSAVERRRQQYKIDPMKALFATVAVERETNPFLSCSSVVEFAALRRKDREGLLLDRLDGRVADRP